MFFCSRCLLCSVAVYIVTICIGPAGRRPVGRLTAVCLPASALSCSINSGVLYYILIHQCVRAFSTSCSPWSVTYLRCRLYAEYVSGIIRVHTWVFIPEYFTRVYLSTLPNIVQAWCSQVSGIIQVDSRVYPSTYIPYLTLFRSDVPRCRVQVDSRLYLRTYLTWYSSGLMFLRVGYR